MHFSWSTLALQAINFAILVWLLHRFLYRPVLRVIDSRKADIQRQYDEARTADEAAQARVTEAEAARSGIIAERETMLKDAAARADEAAATRRRQAEHDAQVLIESARRMLAEEREHAREELRGAALDLAVDFAERLLIDFAPPIATDGWLDRIAHHIKVLPDAERRALGHELSDGAVLRIVTASPLSADQTDTWRQRLQAALGGGTFLFETDPTLIAGADLHFPAAALRFSWRSALIGLRAGISAHDDAR